MKMKTALVTGANGFIGVKLANSLQEKGYSVVAMDKTFYNYEKLHGDISLILHDVTKSIPQIKRLDKVDVVYHLAALRSLPESFKIPEEYIMTNIWGTYNIVKSFPSSRVVFASSSAASESKCVYGATKRSAEHFINQHPNSVSVRFMNVFGEGQIDTSMAIPAFCNCLKHNKKAIINGDGQIQRDYTYVLDLVDELINIGESRIKGQTETGYGSPIKILNLYKQIAKLFKKKDNFRFGPGRKGDMKLTCSKYKIKEPIYGFNEGLRRTVRWYMEEATF